MIFVRYGLPAVLIIVGFVLLFAADDTLKWDGFAMCVGAGLAVLLMNVLFRVGASGEKERKQEDDARDFYTEHGFWPGEGPGTR